MSRFRPDFDEGRALIVMRPFTYRGRSYKPHLPFDWREIGLSVQEVANLYRFRRLRHVAPSDTVEDAPKKRGRPKTAQATVAAP